jgi:hypothetical protein
MPSPTAVTTIILAVTRERRSGAFSVPPVQNCSSCRPYSPDLNPIEQVFATLKTLLRKAAERTVEATWRRIGILLSRFTPQECANYLGMRQLFRQRRIRLNMKQSCSSTCNSQQEFSPRLRRVCVGLFPRARPLRSYAWQFLRAWHWRTSESSSVRPARLLHGWPNEGRSGISACRLMEPNRLRHQSSAGLREIGMPKDR